MVTNVPSPNIDLKPKDYKSDVHPDWCPGCGDFGIVNCIQQVFAELKLDPTQVLMYSGVGCSSKTPHYIKTYGVHTLHGRSLPFAIGSKLANPDLHVVTAGGDGDGYGIGAGHFLGAGRRNVNLTYIVYNNEVYGLTKGQASPTLKLGMQTKSLPLPNPNDGVNPLAIAISAGYTFVARSYAFDAKHLKDTLKRAIMHKGMSLVDILQPCPTYNNLHTKDWFAEEVEINGSMYPRTYHIEAEGYDGKVKDSSNPAEIEAKKMQALEKVQISEARVPLGVFYQVELPDFLERVKPNIPLLQQYTSAKMPIEDPATHVPTTDLASAYAEVSTDTF
jgi:2-oxoglutarate/2-oxoacid ferredoxin oxidoreductase subunit beta